MCGCSGGRGEVVAAGRGGLLDGGQFFSEGSEKLKMRRHSASHALISIRSEEQTKDADEEAKRSGSSFLLPCLLRNS